MKEKLKIPQLQHPQTLEVLEAQQGHEELMDLVLKLNDQLKETENELDALIQLKQENVATSSTNVIPTVSRAVRSTLAASLAPTTPVAIALLITTESTSAVGASGEKVVELIKSMEEIPI